MPLTGYLSVAGINSALAYAASNYPTLCQLVVAPEPSIAGRVCQAIKFAHGAGPNLPAILIVGGVHARELVNPDMLAALALKLCQTYVANTGLTFGSKTFDAATIQSVVNQSDTII